MAGNGTDCLAHARQAGGNADRETLAVTVCQNCGSRRFRADRSMAGRLVCQNCGLAAGSRAERFTPHSSRRSNAKRWLVILLIAVIVLVVVTS